MLYLAIVGCEIGFWVMLLGGLLTRYQLRRPRAGAILLTCVPLVDLGLLVLSLIDLSRGGAAEVAHALAAVYIGVSVAFGHRMLRWTDERFAYRFAAGPAPTRPPKYGPQHARHERGGWYRHAVAWAIGCGLLLGGAAFVGDPATAIQLVLNDMIVGEAKKMAALLAVSALWTIVLVVDFVWSFSYTIWPRKP